MANRYTDTAKWDKAWFRKLTPELKCAWLFLCDKCDHAGFWDVDEDALKHYVGVPISLTKLIENFPDRIEVVGPDKILLTKFVEFQYKHLNPANRVHKSVIERLEKQGVNLSSLIKNKPLKNEIKVLQVSTEGAKGEEEDKDYDKDKDPVSKNEFVHPTKLLELRMSPEAEELKGCLLPRYGKSLHRHVPKILEHWGSIDNYLRFVSDAEKSWQRGTKEYSVEGWVEYLTKERLGLVSEKRT
jgi:hypothetical protein